MDHQSFDNLVRDLAESVQSRRSLVMATVGVALLFVAPTGGDTEAARRRQARHKKTGRSNHKRGRRSGQGSGGGKKPHGGHQGDCEKSETCPRDPETDRPGFLCPDGLCSCGGTCCEKGYACFVEKTTPGREVCCYIDGDQTLPPEDAKLLSCPGELFDPETCCDLELCQPDGSCSGLTLGRYRRNPR